jgi:hypothetical protein
MQHAREEHNVLFGQSVAGHKNTSEPMLASEQTQQDSDAAEKHWITAWQTKNF